MFIWITFLINQWQSVQGLPKKINKKKPDQLSLLYFFQWKISARLQRGLLDGNWLEDKKGIWGKGIEPMPQRCQRVPMQYLK